MAISVERLHPTFMAQVDGVDLTKPVAPDVFAVIGAAFNEHAILLFREQLVTDAQQVEFSAHFGPVFQATKYYMPGERQRLRSEMADISNIGNDGGLLAADDTRRLFQRANQLWHTDNTFKHVPARCSLLSAREIPATGGETEFADMRAAYDALPAERKEEIEGLVVEHSIFRSREKMGYKDFTDGARTELPPVQQVLVRTNQVTGRKALYIASHASHVVGWPMERGRHLIEELLEFATQPQFVYQHRWAVGDLILWDNRASMHRARPYAEMRDRRVLHRTTVSDEINSVERARIEQSSAA